MNGVHDVGGMDGFGPVEHPEDEPVFHARWEQRVFSMLPACGLTTDQFRYGVELTPPLEYLGGRYYEHWLHTVERGLIDQGVITRADLERRRQHFRSDPTAEPPPGGSPALADTYVAALREGTSTRRPAPSPPRFAVGDRVRVRNDHPTGHTRSARYVRGRVGTVAAAYGAFVFPDTNAVGQGEHPQHVYNVRFEAAELWGDGAERAVVHFDLWEPYLEPDQEPTRRRGT